MVAPFTVFHFKEYSINRQERGGLGEGKGRWEDFRVVLMGVGKEHPQNYRNISGGHLVVGGGEQREFQKGGSVSVKVKGYQWGEKLGGKSDVGQLGVRQKTCH